MHLKTQASIAVDAVGKPFDLGTSQLQFQTNANSSSFVKSPDLDGERNSAMYITSVTRSGLSQVSLMRLG